MTPKTYKASIQLKNGQRQEITVQADNVPKAKQLIEMQYGKGCIKTAVVEVRK